MRKWRSDDLVGHLVTGPVKKRFVQEVAKFRDRAVHKLFNVPAINSCLYEKLFNTNMR